MPRHSEALGAEGVSSPAGPVRLRWVLPTIGVLIIIAGVALDAVSGALGGSVTAFGGIFVSATMRDLWRARPSRRVALIVVLSVVCLAVGLFGAVRYSAWDWVLVGYGALLAVLGLVPFRADDRAAAARARHDAAPQ